MGETEIVVALVLLYARSEASRLESKQKQGVKRKPLIQPKEPQMTPTEQINALERMIRTSSAGSMWLPTSIGF